mmetsp:Transcript_23751/g.68365  ORF Transcript_23751/g.68365 Transcript_23751/m.68365 type:complete len:220 (+) Transcript_23751:31-690(+)
MLPGEVACVVAGRRAALWLRAGSSSGLGVVMLHPHPHYGGNMDDDRVSVVLRELHQRDGVAATLRFDFGSDLSACPAAVEAALALIREQPCTSAAAIAGYSYGSAALCELLCDRGREVLSGQKPLRAVAFLAPPLEMMLPGREESVSAGMSRLLEAGLHLTLVAGTEDDYCPEPQLRSWHERLGGTALLHIVAGADHFFSRPEWLREAVRVVVGGLVDE